MPQTIEERRAKNREFMREYGKRPEVLARSRERQRRDYADPVKRAKSVAAAKRYGQSEKGRAQKNANQRRRRSDPEYRKKWNEHSRIWMGSKYRSDPEFRGRVNAVNRRVSREKRKDPEFRAAEYKRRKERLREEPRLAARVRETEKRYLANPDKRARRNLLKARRNLEKYRADHGYRMECCLRTRLSEVLAGSLKSAPTMRLVGCTRQELVEHIETLFKPGMSWSNHGMWHLDHKLPCAHFDLSDAAQQKTCFHYTNLQPLWARENIQKGAKIL